MKVTNTDHTAINDNHSKCRMNQTQGHGGNTEDRTYSNLSKTKIILSKAVVFSDFCVSLHYLNIYIYECVKCIISCPSPPSCLYPS